MFGRLLCLGLLSVVLSGCNQFMGGMPDRMERMNNQVDRTNVTLDELYKAMRFANENLELSVNKLDEVERHQTYAGSMAIVVDRSGELLSKAVRGVAPAGEGAEEYLSNLSGRVRMAQVLIAISDLGIDPPFVPGEEPPFEHREDQLYEVIGALGPLKFPALDLNAEGLGYARNVSIVSKNPSRESSVVNIPLDYELHNVFALAVQRMSRKLVNATADKHYDRSILRERALNLFYAGTAILGASTSAKKADYSQNKDEATKSFVIHDKSNIRSRVAEEMIAIRGSLEMDNLISEDTLKLFIENRLGGGLRKDQKVEKLNKELKKDSDK